MQYAAGTGVERVLVDDQFFAEGEAETASKPSKKKKRKMQRCNRTGMLG
eukprot:COSAG02_NODE_23563_length_715_cov_0.750000_1_plen_48_part_10